MGRMAGYFEWDDDELHPGRRSEGGLSDNLYTANGRLKGRARFVPTDDDPEPVVTESVYVTAEIRREQTFILSPEVSDMLADLLYHYADTKIRPAVQRWWSESAKPRMAARTERIRNGHLLRRRPKASEVLDSADMEPGVADPVVEVARSRMSAAEAQARVMAAAAAQAFFLEQLRLVESSQIVGADAGADSLAVAHQVLAELPPAVVQELVEAMVLDPALLGEENLAQLASRTGALRGRQLE